MARLIWDDDKEQPRVADPRHPVFARAVIDEFSTALRETPGVIRNVMQGASSAAEDLNVEPFQGPIEVIQNADDLGAEEVRLALRETGGTKELLIVHDGDPVTYEQ